MKVGDKVRGRRFFEGVLEYVGPQMTHYEEWRRKHRLHVEPSGCDAASRSQVSRQWADMFIASALYPRRASLLFRELSRTGEVPPTFVEGYFNAV